MLNAACYAVLFVSALSLINYLYGTEEIFGLKLHTQMALNTAGAFLGLGFGLMLLRLPRSRLGGLASGGTGGVIARRLLPVVVVVPVFLGWLRAMGQLAGLYGTNSGVALMAALVSLALVIGVLVTADTLEQVDQARRAAVEQLAIQSAEIQDLYERAPCGYHSLDAEGTFVRVNETELDWLGYTREELLGQVKVMDLMTPDSAARFAEAFPKFRREGQVRDLRFHFRRKDGSILPVLVSASAVIGPDGEYLMSRSTLQDMTALERAELELMRHQRDLEEANRELAWKNEELDQFADTAGHDLQEPLRKLIAFSDLLRRDLPTELPPSAREDLDHIVRATQRMQDLLQGLLVLARMGKAAMSWERVDLNHCLSTALEDLGRLLGESGARVDCAPLPEVWGDRELLTRVFQNLLGNAMKFRRPDSSPWIKVSAERDGRRWLVRVEDDGIGIDPEHLADIFFPFKRLHGQSRFPGSGLGLAISRKVLERHHGQIWAESGPGPGSRFTFALEARDFEVEPRSDSNASIQEVR